MKRARPTSTVFEETYFSWLPSEIFALVKAELRPVWHYTLKEALYGSATAKKLAFNPDLVEIAKYGLKITQFLFERRLIGKQYIARLACFWGDLDLFNWGLSVDSCNYKAGFLKYAILGDQREMLKYLLSIYKCRRLDLVEPAISTGNLGVLKEIYLRHPPRKEDLLIAARSGQPEIYFYLQERLQTQPTEKELKKLVGSPPINQSERMKMVQRDNDGVIERKRVLLTHFRDSGLVIDATLYEKVCDIEMVYLLEEFDCQVTEEHIRKWKGLVHRGFQIEELLLHVLERPHPNSFYDELMRGAVICDHLPVVKRLQELGVDWTAQHTEWACINPSLNVIEYLLEQKVPLTVDCLAPLARQRAYPLLIQIHQENPQLVIPNSCFYFLLQDFKKIPKAKEYLQYMWSVPNSWTDENIVAAIYYGQVEAVKFLESHQVPLYAEYMNVLANTILVEAIRDWGRSNTFSRFKEFKSKTALYTESISKLYQHWKRYKESPRPQLRIIDHTPSPSPIEWYSMNACLEDRFVRHLSYIHPLPH